MHTAHVCRSSGMIVDFRGPGSEEREHSLRAGEKGAGRAPWRFHCDSPELWATWRGSDSSG